MKYSFILEIDEISKDDINELISVLSDNKIKFHVLKSDKELKENQKYKEVIDRAVQLAYQYAQIDGGHHKMWVIDQMMRILLGSKYDNFVKEYEEDGEYEWNIGIAP